MSKPAPFLFLLVVGLFFGVKGLSGPSLYIYSDSGVYAPGSYANFRVLAVDENQVGVGEVGVYVSVINPNSEVVYEYEGATDEGGWFVFSVYLESEGVYRVVADAVDPQFGEAETVVLVCSTCPRQVETITVTNTATITVANTTITNVVRSTLTSTLDRTTTLTSLYTTTVATSLLTTVTESLTTTLVQTRVVETTVVRSILSTVTQVFTSVVNGRTITQVATSVLTEQKTVTSTVTQAYTVAVSGPDDSLFPLAFIAVVFLVLFSVVVYAVRFGGRRF
ncbi:MAG: hypothetical protein QXU87_08615 [Candidatus Caldarchaeum sp.]